MGEAKDGSKIGSDVKRDTGDMGREAVWVIKSVGLHLDVCSLWVKSTDGANRQWEGRV